MMNLTESAKQPSGKRPKKRKFTGNMHTRCKAVHSVDESLNNSASEKRFSCKMLIHLLLDMMTGFDSYRVFDKTIIFTNIQNFAYKKCGGDIKLSENVLERSLSSFCEIYILHPGDGDSKTFSSITASNPYGEDITEFQKLNLLDMSKRMGTCLRKN
ncbi:hypothetical protein TNCV_3380171 [Trichonephila clavipes]|nr:hypothetical protein TNCV_3380171 [Trichonephila clavipes]